jgi:hypothetical protein
MVTVLDGRPSGLPATAYRDEEDLGFVGAEFGRVTDRVAW